MFAKVGIIVLVICIKASIQCSYGDIRLVNGSKSTEGRVEVCVDSSWGTVCHDGWGAADAQVVCRQLGYNPEGAEGLRSAVFGQGIGDIVLDNVRCNSREEALLECGHRGLFRAREDCNHSKDAGVRCHSDQRLQNVSTKLLNMSTTNAAHTVLISWNLQNSSLDPDKPLSYYVKCFNEWHSVILSVSNESYAKQLEGLLPAAQYNCCVLAVYESYTAKGVCDEIETPALNSSTSSTTREAPESFFKDSNKNNVVVGVLGFIVTVLLIMVAVSGIAMVFLWLRSKQKNFAFTATYTIPSSDRRSTIRDVPAQKNISYAKPTTTTTTTKSIASGALSQPSVSATKTQDEAQCPDYSCVGPDYETINTMKQSQRKNQAHSRLLSERYEYSEAHLATLTDSVPEGRANYEVPLSLRLSVNTEDLGDYSHLKH